MANIVIGKIGRSMYFDRKKWKDAAGNNEAPLLYSALAKLNPQNTYYMIGKSDLSRIDRKIYSEWFPNDNIIDVWAEFNSKTDDPTIWISKMMDGIKVGYGIIHGGMCSLSIPDRIYCLDRKNGGITDQVRKPIMSLVNYVSPITYYLNESGINWLTVTSDGRYMPLQARDLINPEKISLGVREGEVEIKRMKSYDDQLTMINHKVKLVYAAAETQYLLDYLNLPNEPGIEKTQKVGMFFHQYDDKKRIKALEDFLINNFDETELAVYGKWDPEKYSGPKFKGSVTFEKLQDILPSVKYTFCYPIIKGDISGKWVEAVYHGIIPFFHTTYDENRLLVKNYGIGEWFYVSSPEELKEKIKFLESSKNAYDKARQIFHIVIQRKFIDGTHFNELINKSVDEMKKM